MDWNIVFKITGGGLGITILVLAILSIVSWIMGLIWQRIQERGE